MVLHHRAAPAHHRPPREAAAGWHLTGHSSGGSTVTQDDERQTAGRLGLLGHGTYYLLLTLLCARLLLGNGGDEAGAQGAIATVARQPFGQVLLGGLTMGMVESMLTLSPVLKTVRPVAPYLIAAAVLIVMQRGTQLVFARDE